MKEEDPGEDIKEVKAETEDVAVEDGGGGGVFGCDPWLRGEAGHAWGLSHANQQNMLTLPWVQGALDSGYSPHAPPFFRRPSWHTSPCAGHFAAFGGTASATRVLGGPGGTQGGHGHGNPNRQNPCPPSAN